MLVTVIQEIMLSLILAIMIYLIAKLAADVILSTGEDNHILYFFLLYILRNFCNHEEKPVAL
jgi:cation transporter-like permease